MDMFPIRDAPERRRSIDASRFLRMLAHYPERAPAPGADGRARTAIRALWRLGLRAIGRRRSKPGRGS
jgi:hypothetical protein